MTPKQLLVPAALALALGGCIPGEPGFLAGGPPFAPEKYFAGRTQFTGVTESAGAGEGSRFSGSMTGRREDSGAVRLEESMTFSNGAKLARTWRIRRLDGQRIEATGSDIAGTATGELTGRRMHLRYAAAPTAADPMAGVEVEHWMDLQDDGVTVLNRTVTRRGGLVVRMTTERMVRSEEPKEAAAPRTVSAPVRAVSSPPVKTARAHPRPAASIRPPPRSVRAVESAVPSPTTPAAETTGSVPSPASSRSATTPSEPTPAPTPTPAVLKPLNDDFWFPYELRR